MCVYIHVHVHVPVHCTLMYSLQKINSKNAFGLHLIDYMLEMLLERGELENFQVSTAVLLYGTFTCTYTFTCVCFVLMLMPLFLHICP